MSQAVRKVIIRTPHSPLLMIVDEAKSVESEIFQALDRCTYNVLLVYQPSWP